MLTAGSADAEDDRAAGQAGSQAWWLSLLRPQFPAHTAAPATLRSRAKPGGPSGSRPRAWGVVPWPRPGEPGSAPARPSCASVSPLPSPMASAGPLSLTQSQDPPPHTQLRGCPGRGGGGGGGGDVPVRTACPASLGCPGALWRQQRWPRAYLYWKVMLVILILISSPSRRSPVISSSLLAIFS